MKKIIRRLRLREGDIVVCKDPETALRLSRIGFCPPIVNAPIVVAPEGIKRVNRKYLFKILGISEDKKDGGLDRPVE